MFFLGMFINDPMTRQILESVRIRSEKSTIMNTNIDFDGNQVANGTNVQLLVKKCKVFTVVFTCQNHGLLHKDFLRLKLLKLWTANVYGYI